MTLSGPQQEALTFVNQLRAQRQAAQLAASPALMAAAKTLPSAQPDDCLEPPVEGGQDAAVCNGTSVTEALSHLKNAEPLHLQNPSSRRFGVDVRTVGDRTIVAIIIGPAGS